MLDWVKYHTIPCSVIDDTLEFGHFIATSLAASSTLVATTIALGVLCELNVTA